MRLIFLVLALMFGLIIAAAAIINNEVVTVNYFFGQVNLTLFMLILGSAVTGALFMGSLSIYRGINNYMSSQGDRGLKKELQNRVKTLEGEKKELEEDLSDQQEEREKASSKAYESVENEKKRLEDELRKQQKEHEETVVKMHNS